MLRKWSFFFTVIVIAFTTYRNVYFIYLHFKILNIIVVHFANI